ncbi:MAG: choice-of-anchor D domain-containing protein, partial [Prosthecobacter sp.]|nr:choice-of-anchor D domain-containing protein [Prosthecobacter sp.]
GLSGNGTQQIQLMGAGKTAPIVNYSTYSKATVALGTDFGPITGAVPKTPTKTLSFNIRNTGGGVLTLTSNPRVVLNGTHASQFEVTVQPSISAIPARVGTKGISSTAFSIRYQPTTKGTHFTTVTIASDSADDPTFQFKIRGSAPDLTALPAGDVTHLASASLEVAGWGTSETTSASALDYGGDSDAFRFVLTQRNLCSFWTTGDTDTYGTLYKLVGTKATKLIAADAGGDGRNFLLTSVLDAGTYVVEVKGAAVDILGDYELHAQQTPVSGYAVLTNPKGTPIADDSTLIDAALNTDFGLIDSRTGYAERTFTLTNNGFADITLPGGPRVQISGAGAEAFVVKAQPTATALKPAAKITFTLRYDPADKGYFDAVVSIPLNGAGLTGNTYDFAIHGSAFGAIEPLRRATHLGASKLSSCFFDADGGVKNWGLVVTMFGNYDAPTPEDGIFNFPNAPMAVAGGSNRFQVAMPDGSVSGWGSYSQVSLGYGEDLGDDYWEESPQPASRLWGSDEAVQLAIGATHTVVMTNSGGVWTWGDGTTGQLGTGTVLPYKENLSHIKKTAASITSKFGTSRIIQIAAGSFHTLALDNAGNVWSWGRGAEGQLGHGTSVLKSAPTKISPAIFGGYRVVGIACAADSSYAVTEAGVVWAWGGNENGALGDGSLTNSMSPVKVLDPATGSAHTFGGQPIVQITAGSDQVFVLTAGGSVWTWGEGINVEADMTYPYGETPEALNSWTAVWQSPRLLVDGATDPAPPIVEMTAAGQRVGYWSDDVMLADLSLTHALFLRTDGSVWACGDNTNGQVGDGTFTGRALPVEVLATPVPTVPGVIKTGFFEMMDSVYALGMHADGKILVGGGFETAVIEPRNGIARLNADGWVDSAFNPK